MRPFRTKLHNELMLLGLINVILNLIPFQLQTMFSSHGHNTMRTSTTPPTAGYVGLCLCLWWMDFLGGCHCSAKEILNHSALLWNDKKRLCFLLSIIICPCSLGVNQMSIDAGHGVRFDIHASFIEVIKAYTSYLKSKKEKSSLTGKGGQASSYVEQFY